jgi:AP-1 complex subunit gamma-1
LGNISSKDMARDLAPEVEKLLSSANPYLRKKAALCAIRVLRKCPDLMENFVPKIRSLLSERNHGVLLTGVTLMTELCESDPHNIEFFRRLVPTLVRILKNLVMSGYAPEYDVSGITDPFLQVRILKLLRLLGKGDTESSDVMNDILAQVATNTDHTRNVGNAILYECVQTIMNIDAEDGLRLLAINVLGRFLANKDNNIRYVALATLSKVINADIEAVQRHRNTIVDCLKDPDVSIRKRALDLIYALVNESNIKILAHELLNFLQSASQEFRADLATKLCDVTERFAPNKRWHVDTILRVLSIAGNHVPEEVSCNLVTLIASTPELHSYAVQKMYIALTTDTTQQSLVQVALWCIGEFGDLLVSGGGTDREITVSENDVVDLLERIVKSPSTLSTTKDYVVTAAMKLTTRLTNPSSVQRLRQIILSFQNNIDVELQQRAIEYSTIFKWDNIRKQLLERIPVQEVVRTPTNVLSPATTPDIKKPGAAVGSSSSSNNNVGNLLDWDDAAPAATPKSPSSGANSNTAALLDIFGGGPTPVAPTPATTTAAKPPVDPLGDLLGLGPISPTPSVAPVSPLGGGLQGLLATPTPVSGGLGGLEGLSLGAPVSSPTPSSPSAPLNGPLPTMTVYNKNGLTVYFDVVKQAQYPNITLINCSFANSTPSPMNNFEFKAAVPKCVNLQVKPPSGNVVAPMNSGRLTQQIKMQNTLHGEKPLLLKIKLDYLQNGAPVSDIADVTFPSGV